jgi:adenylylsulfate kinase
MTTGLVAWITGLPSAGKSTFAERARDMLVARGASVCLLDGDEVRASLVPAVGYAAEDRASFYATLANFAALLARQGHVVLVAATASRRAFREQARALSPAFLEVLIDTPPEACAERDTKGLYARARAGAAPDVPGASAPYERPTHPDVVARDGLDPSALAATCAQIVQLTGNVTQESPLPDVP